MSQGDPFPDYAAEDLEDREVALSDLEDRPYMLKIWATWCAPCVREMPKLQELHETMPNTPFTVVAVSIDRHGAGSAVEAFLEEHRINLPIWRDPRNRVSRTLRATGVLETFLVDHEGRLMRRWVGLFDPTEEEVVAQVRELVGASWPRGRRHRVRASHLR